MSAEISIIPGTQIALFCWTGEITLEGRINNVSTIMQFCRENRVANLIVDLRQQINKTSTMQMFDFASSLPDATRGLKIALVTLHDDEDIAFAENVAANRGATTRMFETIDDAMVWLNG